MRLSRALRSSFFEDLQAGLLKPLLDRVNDDDTLMLALRGSYINIYYRGGSLLKIEASGKGLYRVSFDVAYNKASRPVPVFPTTVASEIEVSALIELLPALKDIMDRFFAANGKPEREFQQLVARENNRSAISNETEYFIADIEFADSELAARIDMLALRWRYNERQSGRCRAALVEMKYGDAALGGSSGLLKHLRDLDQLLGNPATKKALIDSMEEQINQLSELGLLKFNRSKRVERLRISDETPEVIFLLANHNPRSKSLDSILSELANLTASPGDYRYVDSPHYDLRFFVSSFSGYGMHHDCMLKFDEFRTRAQSSIRCREGA